MKRRVPELVIGFLLGVVLVSAVFLLNSDTAAHYQICQNTHAGAKECASYNVISYALFKIWTALDALNGAITAIATAFIAWFTFSLRQSTDKLWDAGERQLGLLRESGEVQTRDMQASIVGAVRAAAAMENVASSIQANGAAQLRAYISVLAGKFIEQHDGANFEYQPCILNAGFTPAYDVIIFCKVAVLPFPLSADFDFSIPEGPEPSVGVLGFQQSTIGIAALDRQLSPDEIAEIKSPGGRRLYNYGYVTYRDFLDRPHRTNYCFYTVWGSQAPVALTTRRHNDAD